MSDNNAVGKAKGFIGEFQKFLMRGNVLDMAVGVVIGSAFGGIVTSLVNDLLMPVISLIAGGLDFSNWFLSLDGSKYATLAAAQEAGAATLNYGVFLTKVINFVIVAFCIFLVIKAFNALEERIKPKKEEPEAPKTKICPFCKMEVPIDAVKCGHCASDLPEEA
ncbi:MAG: large conductance mechanosensitive channel protein MscL [Lachnospiraceae bacterium]|nr:large conductance mechanosensitive channel protein MscL [Lachnospiraceae bacterium]